MAVDLLGIGTAVSGIANSISQGVTSRKNLKDQIAFSKSQADLEYQRAIEQRDYMNQYNAPVMQMKRYKEAGLNPHLIYGKGGSAGQQTQLPKYNRAEADFSQRKAYEVPNLVGLYQQSRINEAGINNTNKDSALKEHQAMTEKTKQALNMANSNNAIARTLGQKIINEWLPLQQSTQIQERNANIVKSLAQADYTKQQTVTELKRAGLIDAQTATELQRKDLTVAQREKIIQETALAKVNTAFAKVRMAFFEAYEARGYDRNEILWLRGIEEFQRTGEFPKGIRNILIKRGLGDAYNELKEWTKIGSSFIPFTGTPGTSSTIGFPVGF